MDLMERLQELDKLELRKKDLLMQKDKITNEIKNIRKQRNELLKFTWKCHLYLDDDYFSF